MFQSLSQSSLMAVRPIRIVLVEFEIVRQFAMLILKILHCIHEQIHRNHLQDDRKADFPRGWHKISERKLHFLLPQQVLSRSKYFQTHTTSVDTTKREGKESHTLPAVISSQNVFPSITCDA